MNNIWKVYNKYQINNMKYKNYWKKLKMYKFNLNNIKKINNLKYQVIIKIKIIKIIKLI